MTLADIMAVPGYTSRAECSELANWATGATRVLEIGHLHGRSTAAILWGLHPGTTFVTIDHHRGDVNIGASDYAEFLRNIAPHVAASACKDFYPLNESFEASMPQLAPPFDLIYYDAMHAPEACATFWALVVPLLASRAVLAYDDADWPQMARLGELAEAYGFKDVTRQPLQRSGGGKEVRDIGAPGDYTMRVLLLEGENT